jgi:hypothetical protein
VYLADTEQAYSGHAIIETYRGGTWGAVDAAAGVVYLSPAGEPVATWSLMNRPDLVEAHARFSCSTYARPGQFRCAAISNYSVWDRARYDYTVSPVNEYYRSILAMSNAGWPGGLRWLHGEDANSTQGANLRVITVPVSDKFDSIASTYDEQARYLEQWDGQVLIDMLGDVRGKSVLDIGCGTGRLLCRLRDMGADTTGILCLRGNGASGA